MATQFPSLSICSPLLHSVLLIYFSVLCNAHVLNSVGTCNIKSMLVNTALYFIHMVMIVPNFKMIILLRKPSNRATLMPNLSERNNKTALSSSDSCPIGQSRGHVDPGQKCAGQDPALHHQCYEWCKHDLLLPRCVSLYSGINSLCIALPSYNCVLGCRSDAAARHSDC